LPFSVYYFLTFILSLLPLIIFLPGRKSMNHVFRSEPNKYYYVTQSTESLGHCNNIIISILFILFLISLFLYLLLKIFVFNKTTKVFKHMNVVSSENTLYIQLIVPYNGYLTCGRTLYVGQRIKTLYSQCAPNPTTL